MDDIEAAVQLERDRIVAIIIEAAGDCIWPDGLPGYIDIDDYQTRQMFAAIRDVPLKRKTPPE